MFKILTLQQYNVYNNIETWATSAERYNKGKTWGEEQECKKEVSVLSLIKIKTGERN